MKIHEHLFHKIEFDSERNVNMCYVKFQNTYMLNNVLYKTPISKPKSYTGNSLIFLLLSQPDKRRLP